MTSPDQTSPPKVSSYVLTGGFVADMAHLALNDLKDMKWPVGRSTLYRMAHQGLFPSTTKLVKFLDTFAQTGLNPAAPKHDTTFNLWAYVGDALDTFFSRCTPMMGPDPIRTQIMDRWVPVILAKPELQENLVYPLAHVYPSYEELHEMGAWDRSVSPYELLAVSNPKAVTGFAKMLYGKYSKGFKTGGNTKNLLGLYNTRTAHTTLSTMKSQHIVSNFYPGPALAKVASTLASMAMGASCNLNWEYAIANQKAKTLPDDLYQFGRFDIESLQQDFEARLRSGPFPCTVQATFTPELRRRYEEARKYRASFTPEFGMVDEIKLNDLFCYSIASEITLKWSAAQLLALSLYFHVPLHCLLLWVMEATVVYRRRFASDNTVNLIKMNITEMSDISTPVYDEAFFNDYRAFTSKLSSSKSSRYHEMKQVADKLLNIDHAKVESGEEPVEELEAFYELILGAPNGYATNPLSDKQIRRIESRLDPEVVRPTDLYGDYDEDDDDEPAVSLMDVLDDDDYEDEEEATFALQPVTRLPTVEEYKALGHQPKTKFVPPESVPSSAPATSPSPSPSTDHSDNVMED